MPLRRAIVSCNPLEWWNTHLNQSLSRRIEVVDYSIARPNKIGYPVETNICDLVGSEDAGSTFYLGSLDQLFAGIQDLHLRTAIWTDYLEAANHPFRPCLQLFDVVLCSQRSAIADLERAGIRQVVWLPFAYDTTLMSDPTRDKLYDVAFVGSLNLPPSRRERSEILGRLAGRFRCNDYCTPVFGIDMMRVYNQARIVVNIPAPGSFNMRTFEALASGAMLLTKAVGSGQEVLFEDGHHLVTYQDANDLISKVEYYLKHDVERERIAAAGMKEVLAKHTYEHRVARVLEVVSGASPTRSRDTKTATAAYAVYYEYLRRADLVAVEALATDVAVSSRVRLLTRAAAKLARRVMERRGSDRAKDQTRNRLD